MIILEGPDCGGKTTLAGAFPEWYQKTHFHHEEKKLPRYQKFLNERQLNPKGILLDRFHLSEAVYGPTLRGTNELVFTGRFLERQLLTMGAVVVLCLPPWRSVRARWEDRLERELVKDDGDFKAIYDGYCTIETSLPVITYDYTAVSNTEAFVNHIVGIENRAKICPVWGSSNAGVVLVGDDVSGDDQVVPFSRGDKGCSTWLAEQLEFAGISEQHLSWINSAADFTERQVDFMNERPLIALGSVAAARLNEQGFNCSHTPHPQYWKRFHFHSKEPYPLINLLKDML